VCNFGSTAGCNWRLTVHIHQLTWIQRVVVFNGREEFIRWKMRDCMLREEVAPAKVPPTLPDRDSNLGWMEFTNWILKGRQMGLE